jgi:hypothetical protein
MLVLGHHPDWFLICSGVTLQPCYPLTCMLPYLMLGCQPVSCYMTLPTKDKKDDIALRGKSSEDKHGNEYTCASNSEWRPCRRRIVYPIQYLACYFHLLVVCHSPSIARIAHNTSILDVNMNHYTHTLQN